MLFQHLLRLTLWAKKECLKLSPRIGNRSLVARLPGPGLLTKPMFVSLNSLSVRVPQKFSRASIAHPGPESVSRAVAGRCRDWFYSKTNVLVDVFCCPIYKTNTFFNDFRCPIYKTNAFLMISLARSIKPMLFIDFRCPVYKTNAFLMISIARSVTPMLFQRFRWPDL